LLIDLILFERSLIDHTGMSQQLEGFSVDSSSSKQDKSSLGMMTGSSKYSSLTTTAELDVYDIPFFVSWWVFSTDLILFERSLIDHTGMSQQLESFSVDSSSSKQDKSSIGIMIGSLTTTAELHLYDMPFFDSVVDKFDE
jgi:hypothetical protein